MINILLVEVWFGFIGFIVYGLSKGVLNMMILFLVKYFGERGIIVNIIMFGYMKIDINVKLLDDLEIWNFVKNLFVFGWIG